MKNEKKESREKRKKEKKEKRKKKKRKGKKEIHNEEKIETKVHRTNFVERIIEIIRKQVRQEKC